MGVAEGRRLIDLLHAYLWVLGIVFFEFSAAVGYLVFVLIWIVISIHPWTWRWGADF